MQYKILSTQPTKDYELIDSGNGEKLERYGSVLVRRPDPQALWQKLLPDPEWKKARAIFTRESERAGWSLEKGVPERWEIGFNGLRFYIKPSAFKHTGLFPEHAGNWDWISETIQDSGKRRGKVLNLFGYTGGATLTVALAGAEVTHVDGSKVAVAWARDNAQISGLADRPIRWIVEDVMTYVKREIKRGVRYDGIIMDPPAFGHGANKEIWKIEADFLPLIDLCKQLLSDDPIFLLVNGYASGYSAIAYQNSIEFAVKKFGGEIEIGELTIAEKKHGRLLPAGIFARWRARN